MIKKLLVIMLAVLAIIFTACNKEIFDTQYKFDYAIIKLPNGEIVEGKVEKWTDYEGEQLQITIDGTVYLTSSFNCTLIGKRG